MTEDRPKIADKVMFWQEQDRINQELIPRVLKQHELFSTHVENHDDATSQIAALEARMTATINAEQSKALDKEKSQIVKDIFNRHILGDSIYRIDMF